MAEADALAADLELDVEDIAVAAVVVAGGDGGFDGVLAVSDGDVGAGPAVVVAGEGKEAGLVAAKATVGGVHLVLAVDALAVGVEDFKNDVADALTIASALAVLAGLDLKVHGGGGDGEVADLRNHVLTIQYAENRIGRQDEGRRRGAHSNGAGGDARGWRGGWRRRR